MTLNDGESGTRQIRFWWLAYPNSATNHAFERTFDGKLGPTVSLLYSDNDKALAIQKSATGDFKVRQIGKSKSTKSVYCKGLLEAKKIKKGRYSTQWDEKDQMLVATIT